MKLLSAEWTKLLDRIYNLCSEDSVILLEMEEKKAAATATKERTTAEKQALQEKITTLTEEERILGEEGEKLIAALSKIRTEDFKMVLEKLGSDFNPDKISEEVSESLPQTIKKVQDDKETAKNELVDVEAEMNTAIATIEELLIRKDEALEDQNRLKEYLELALNGNSNITRDSITSLLQKFKFTEDESREAAKLIMFPEDALYAYDAKVRNVEQPGKSISEVFAEAKENIEEEKSYSPREELVKLLNEVGFDYLDFTSNDIDKILANYNEKLLRKNVSCALENNMKLDIFVDNATLLYDPEFVNKVNRLVEIGKEPVDIYLYPNILMKYKLNDLENIIDSFRRTGLDPKMVPLIAY